jgi:putative DNA primase/helicase
LATIPNIEVMLNHYGITTYYDVIKKKAFVNVPMVSGSPDNIDNTSLTACVSLAKLNQLPSEPVPEYIHAIADTNQRNPVADWITAVQWDGIDRLNDLFNTLQVRPDYPVTLRNTLVRRWLISAVAAALKPMGFKARGVLTLQGAQSIGKTSWLESLVPDLSLRNRIVKTDHLLDPSNKDSVMGAVSHWLVELGELDSTFKKDVARLKGFITADMDKLRRPYARLDSEYQRRTVFFASVNDSKFLVDDTGNTRFWTLAVEAINFKHGIDMQQLWAQVVTLYEAGDQWWLTKEEESQLEALNKGHRVVTAVRDAIESHFDFESTDLWLYKNMSATEVLKEIGYDKPTNPQSKEAGAALRELIGEPNSKNRWKVPPTQLVGHFSTT